MGAEFEIHKDFNLLILSQEPEGQKREVLRKVIQQIRSGYDEPCILYTTVSANWKNILIKDTAICRVLLSYLRRTARNGKTGQLCLT